MVPRLKFLTATQTCSGVFNLDRIAAVSSARAAYGVQGDKIGNESAFTLRLESSQVCQQGRMEGIKERKAASRSQRSTPASSPSRVCP